MMNKQSLVVGLLLERLADSKVGILVKGINGIQPDEIAAELSKQNNQTTTSNFPCNFNFTVSNMNRFN